MRQRYSFDNYYEDAVLADEAQSKVKGAYNKFDGLYHTESGQTFFENGTEVSDLV